MGQRIRRCHDSIKTERIHYSQVDADLLFWRIMGSRKNFLASLIALSTIGFFVTDARRSPRMLSASDVAPGELKYQVSLKKGTYNECGGALISERHVLTAAHCFRKWNGPPYTDGLVVTTGTTKLSSGGEHHLAKYVTLHPDYVSGDSANRWRHDIAVVTLATPARTNERQAPVALPSRNVTASVVGLVSGWGQMQKGWKGEYPDDLKKRSVTILTQDDCNSRNAILETQICGFDGVGTGFCSGDSGGPLVYNNEVVGVVSFAVSCGIGYPDIYTRVFAYRNFITEAMKRQ